MWTAKLFILFVAGCAISALICKRLCNFRSWGMDQPDSVRKLHPEPTPRTGGIAIFASLFLLLPVIYHWEPKFFSEWWTVILCSFLMFIVGFSDDLKSIGAKIKLLGQLGVALIAFSLGLTIEKITNPFVAGQVWELGVLSLPVTLFWLVALPNVINLIDGMDGLAGGVAFFMCVILAAMGHFAHMDALTLISVLTAGCIAGFLFFNFPPARIFLGDGGAYFLGFFIATSALNTSHKGAILASLLVVMVGLGIPILDTLFTIIRRMIRGVPIFRADLEHIHHRLLQIGYSKRNALWAIYAVCAALSIIGISILWSQGALLPIALAAVGLLAIFLVRHLGYVTSWIGLKSQVQAALAQRRITQRAIKHSHMLELELDYCGSADEYWDLFRSSLRRLGFSFEPAEGLVCICLTADESVWRVYHERHEGHESDWLRLIECFQQPYRIALRKFPSPVSPS